MLPAFEGGGFDLRQFFVEGLRQNASAIWSAPTETVVIVLIGAVRDS
jgi:hypothetical protein